MAESQVDVIATIRLKNAMKADAAQAKQDIKDVKKEAEKPTQLVVETKPAEEKVARVEKEIRDVRAEAAKPIPIAIDNKRAIQPLVDMQNRLTQMRAELAATQRAASTGGIVGGASANTSPGGFINPERGIINQSRDGMTNILKTVVAIDAALSGIDVAISGVNLTTALWSGSTDDVNRAVTETQNSLRAIPLIGDKIVDLGERINDKFTGAASAAKQIKDNAELASRAIDTQRSAINDATAAYEEMQAVIDRIIERRAQLGLTGQDRAEAQQAQAAADERRRIEDKANQDIEGVREKHKDALKDLETAARNAQKNLDDTSGFRFRDAFARPGAEKQTEIDEARRARDKANNDLVNAEKIRDDEIQRLNDQKNKALAEQEKTAAAEREQINDDALARRTRKEQEAVRRMNAERQKMDEQATKEKQKADEEAADFAQKMEQAAAAEAKRILDDERKQREEVAREEERIAREREQRIHRDTRFTTTRDQADQLQLATIAQAAVSGADVVGNVRRANETSRVTGHDIFGGQMREGNRTEKDQLDVLKTIAENTGAKPGNTLQVIGD